MSTIQSIKVALETAINSMAGRLPTAWENIDFEPAADGSPFQYVNFLPAEPFNPTMRDAFHRELRTIQVTLSYPINGRSGKAYAKADSIRSNFPRGASFTSREVTTVVSRTPTIRPRRVVDGRFLLTVRIPYFANVFE